MKYLMIYAWHLWATLVLVVICGTVQAQVQVVSPAEREAMVSLLPAMQSDADLHGKLRSDDMMWYTLESMPPAYQLGGGQRGNISPTRFADPLLNVSRDGQGTEASKPDGEGGNANIDSPWEIRPGGTDRVVNIRSFKGLWLPRLPDDSGVYPVAVYQTQYRGMTLADDRTWGWDWIYPVGTMFVEVLIQHYEGVDYVFEIRVRERFKGKWSGRMYRPFDTAEELAERIAAMAPKRTQLVRQIASAPSQERRLLVKFVGASDRSANDDVVPLDVTRNVEVLPTMNEALVARLLAKTPFKQAESGWYPVNDSVPFHIVPARYDGMFAGDGSGNSCNNCHEDSTKSARSFDRLRGWYGLVRGNRGGILSWHPVDPAAYKGSLRGRTLASHPATIRGKVGNYPIHLRPEFVKGGIVAEYTNTKDFPSELYHLAK